MYARWMAFAAAAVIFPTLRAGSEPPMLDVVRDDFAFAAAQYSGMLDRTAGTTTNPRTLVNGRLSSVSANDWTSGFFPGALWYLFEYTGEARWRDAAIRCTANVEAAKTRTDTHDVGFIINCSFGNGYRLTATPAYRDVMLTAASSLSTRFNPIVGCIKSWDGRPQWRYPVIIDNMMNLELLTRAAELGTTPRFSDIAISHADKTRQNHFRADYSSYHVVSYDPATGAVEARQTAQGAFDESAWARGQSWGLYGYTMMYRETRHPEYLDQAKRIAAFLMNHPRMPADKVPYWDYDAPGIPNVPRDASAAAIMSSALIELGDYVDPALRQAYVGYAEQQLRSLSSSAYRAGLGDNGNFLLMHSTGNLPGNVEIDVPLIYADYYFLEALLRYKQRSGGAAGIVPAFVTQPVSPAVVDGATVLLTVEAGGSPSPTYAWFRNGKPIAGATNATLALVATDATAGTYTCVATNAAGSATSAAATVSVVPSAQAGRLANISARGFAGSGSQTLIVGFSVAGGENRPASLLVRGMGASLAGYGVTDYLADPAITVYRTGATAGLAMNDNWAGDATLAQLCDRVGAFPFSAPDSQEAALSCGLPSGGYTVQVTGVGGRTGTTLAEVYDAAAADGTNAAHLGNVSVRAQAGTGTATLIAGFVITGPTSRTVLIRGLGPALTPYGVAGVLNDPKLRLFRDGTLLRENDNWGGDAQVAAAAGAVGAFAVSATSKDAMMLVTLPPGAYSAQVVGVNNTTGVALLEVYDVP